MCYIYHVFFFINKVINNVANLNFHCDGTKKHTNPIPSLFNCLSYVYTNQQRVFHPFFIIKREKGIYVRWIGYLRKCL